MGRAHAPAHVMVRRVVPYSERGRWMGAGDRLDSWKEIAEYLNRGVRTVQRWERTAGLPVRRVPSARGAVFAFEAELDRWWRAHSPQLLSGRDDALPFPGAGATGEPLLPPTG